MKYTSSYATTCKVRRTRWSNGHYPNKVPANFGRVPVNSANLGSPPSDLRFFVPQYPYSSVNLEGGPLVPLVLRRVRPLASFVPPIGRGLIEDDRVQIGQKALESQAADAM